MVMQYCSEKVLTQHSTLVPNDIEIVRKRLDARQEC